MHHKKRCQSTSLSQSLFFGGRGQVWILDIRIGSRGFEMHHRGGTQNCADFAEKGHADVGVAS